MPWVILAIVIVLILVVLVRCIVIVPQSNAFVVERLGVYKTTWEAGLHLKFPFIERVARRVSPQGGSGRLPPAAGDHPGQCHHDDRHRGVLPGV